MNELIFILHVIVMSLFLAIAAKRSLLITAFISVSIFLADFIVIKQVHLLGLSSMGSEIYISAATIGLFLLHEEKGEKTTLEVLFSCILIQSIATALFQLHLAYAPSPFDTNSMAYYEAFHHSPQVFIGTLIAFPISIFIGIKLFEYITLHWGNYNFCLRLGLCYLPTHILNTFLFVGAALWGLNHAPILQTIAASFILKMITSH